jgi:hypothetical protein
MHGQAKLSTEWDVRLLERVTGIEPAWPAWKAGLLMKDAQIKILMRSSFFALDLRFGRVWALSGHLWKTVLPDSSDPDRHIEIHQTIRYLVFSGNGLSNRDHWT